MQNQTAIAAKITATVRELAKGDTIFNDVVVASQETTEEKDRTVEKTVVTLVTKIDAPEIKFTADVIKYKSGAATFSFTCTGTDDLTDFLTGLKTI